MRGLRTGENENYIKVINLMWVWPCIVVNMWKIKRPTGWNRWLFFAKLIVHSTCFGHHYAHHQELKNITQVVAACGTWCLGLQVVSLVWSCRLCVQFAGCCSTGSNHLFNTLELLMMGILVPETCWANNKFCNKEPSVASSWPFYFPRIKVMSVN
jgi:hypothetical protein